VRLLQVGRETLGAKREPVSEMPGEAGMRTDPATQLGPVLGKSVHATCGRLRR
jgi:hypothetical protein